MHVCCARLSPAAVHGGTPAPRAPACSTYAYGLPSCAYGRGGVSVASISSLSVSSIIISALKRRLTALCAMRVLCAGQVSPARVLGGTPAPR